MKNENTPLFMKLFNYAYYSTFIVNYNSTLTSINSNYIATDSNLIPLLIILKIQKLPIKKEERTYTTLYMQKNFNYTLVLIFQICPQKLNKNRYNFNLYSGSKLLPDRLGQPKLILNTLDIARQRYYDLEPRYKLRYAQLEHGQHMQPRVKPPQGLEPLRPRCPDSVQAQHLAKAHHRLVMPKLFRTKVKLRKNCLFCITVQTCVDIINNSRIPSVPSCSPLPQSRTSQLSRPAMTPAPTRPTPYRSPTSSSRKTPVASFLSLSP